MFLSFSAGDGQIIYQADCVDELVGNTMRKIFNCMDGVPEEKKLQAMFKRQVTGSRATQKKLAALKAEEAQKK